MIIRISRLKLTNTVGIGLNIIFNFIYMEWWRLLYFSAVLTFIVYLTYLCFNDGLTWDFIEERITPKDYSYLDPTGIPLDDKSYLIVMGGAPNAMGDRIYQLFTAELILP